MVRFCYGVGILIYQPDDYSVCIKNGDLNAFIPLKPAWPLLPLLVLLLPSLVLVLVVLLYYYYLLGHHHRCLSISLCFPLSGCLLDACIRMDVCDSVNQAGLRGMHMQMQGL